MCGVYGIVSIAMSHENVTRRLFQMGKILRHRGLNDQKQVVHSVCCLLSAAKPLGLGLSGFRFLILKQVCSRFNALLTTSPYFETNRFIISSNFANW